MTGGLSLWVAYNVFSGTLSPTQSVWVAVGVQFAAGLPERPGSQQRRFSRQL